MADLTLTNTRLRVRALLKTWGPAWLVMIADVDAASVITAAQSGAQYGTRLVWFLLLLAVPLYVMQELAGRVGVVTRKGLGELIYENYSGRTAVLAAVPMAIVDIVSYIVEYTGIALGFQMVGVPVYLSVPAVFIAHIVLVYKKKYAQAEKPLIFISVAFTVAWIAAAVLTAHRGVQVTLFYVSASPDFLFLLAANVGAVIMPFMLFYQASATAEKEVKPGCLWCIRVETAIGALVSEIIMAAIALAASGVPTSSLDFAAPKVLSQGLVAVAGRFAPYVFSIGLIAASFIALIVISLGSSWGVTEALGWGRKHWFKVYIAESIPAVIVPLVSLDLINMALNLMVLQILVLVGPAVILGLVGGNKSLMGDHRLKGAGKGVYWLMLCLIVGTGLASVVPLLL